MNRASSSFYNSQPTARCKRILALRVEAPSSVDIRALAAELTVFSPCIAFRREHVQRVLFFVDMSTTFDAVARHLDISDERTLLHILPEKISRVLFPKFSAAFAESCAWAQLALAFDGNPAARIHDRQWRLNLPLTVLTELEGLEPWDRPRRVRELIEFVQQLGWNSLADLRRLRREELGERWGTEGDLVWRKIFGSPPEQISPFDPQPPLQTFRHFDFFVATIDLLLEQIYPMLEELMNLAGRKNLTARGVELELHCEFSKKIHSLFIEPRTPQRDIHFFHSLIHRRLEKIELENPIAACEARLVPVPASQEQLSFDDHLAQDKEMRPLDLLISLLAQEGFSCGFLEPTDNVCPESTWQLTTARPRINTKRNESFLHNDEFLPTYGTSLFTAPRPTQWEPQPVYVENGRLKHWRFLSRHPVERLHLHWWSARPVERDYFIVATDSDRLLWVFKYDEKYYIHGYFD